MPFGLGLSSSRSSKSSGSTKVGSLSDAESGRMNMSGILHDGIRKSTSKSGISPVKNSSKQPQPQHYNSLEYNSQEYQQHNVLHTPPRLKSSTSQHQRSPSSQRHSHHNHFQHEMYSQSYSSGHDVISQSYSNHSLGSRHSSHSRHSMTSSSASGQMRHHHHHHHHHHHRRMGSEPGSVHSHPTVTSRSTISDPSGHSRNGSYHHRTSMHQQFNMAEHRDPHGETTSIRRSHHQHQHQSTINTPQRHHHQHHQQYHNSSHPSSRTPNGSIAPIPSSPIIKSTPMKNSSGASVSSFHSRGSAISYNSLAPNSGRSTASATTSVVSKDKYAIKSTKKVIDELKKSNDTTYPMDKKIIALTNACAEFDHLDESRHNMELQQGAATVLYKALALILNSADNEHHVDETGDYGIGNDYEVTPTSDANGIDDANDNMAATAKNEEKNKSTTTNPASSEENDNNDDALRMIATALEMVFRGQSTYVHTAYDKCGGSALYEPSIGGQSPTGLLQLLLRLLDRAEGFSTNYRMKPHNAEVALVNATKVLLYLSRVQALRAHLAKQSNLLDALCRVANKDMGTVESNRNSLSAEARIARVRIITNLVNQEENKPLLLSHRLSDGTDNIEGGVLDALLRVAHTDPNDRAREYAGAAVMDLASAHSNQIPMTKNEQLLGTLVKMIFTEKNPATRESAITALQNLAFTKENRIRLVSFKNGVILEALIRALSSTQKEFNEKSRRRSAGALTNLACDESAALMGKHKGLLQTLAIVSTKDESPEVQTRSAMALTKLAASITVRMDIAENQESDEDSVHSQLLDALVVASLSPVSNSVSAVLRVKARDPENRYLMANHPGIIDTLADMCLYDNRDRENISSHGNDTKTNYSIDFVKDRDNATRALMHLTNESKNRSIMCTPTVLNALVRGASITDDEILRHPKQRQLQDVRDSAIRAIERLATEFSNRHTMAHHDGLIVAIARATEREAKLEQAASSSSSSANKSALAEEPPAISSGNITTNDSVEISSYASSSVLTPQRPNRQSETSFQQHAYLAKPLLMSLLVAM